MDDSGLKFLGCSALKVIVSSIRRPDIFTFYVLASFVGGVASFEHGAIS